MQEPQALINGRFVPASQATVSVADAGFVLGATVSEQLRTFAGRLFRLDAHLDRLWRSLEIVEVAPPMDRQQLADAAQELAAANHGLLEPDDDLGLAIFVTPGLYPTLAGGANAGPTLGVHTYPLPFHLWADQYERGASLATVSVRQVPSESWPPEMKCRSRMHYYLAEREARRLQPGARPLLLDQHGYVNETPTANVAALLAGDGLVAPRREKTLPGISLDYLHQLVARLDVPFGERDVRPDEWERADEALLTSTPFCLLPVTAIDGHPIGNGLPGVMFKQLIDQWSGDVGVDIVAQARQFSTRGAS